MGIFCDCAIPRTAGPVVFFSTELPPDELARFELHGAAVFGRRCSGCHGPGGQGEWARGGQPAARAARPDPSPLLRPGPEPVPLEGRAGVLNARLA